jgi:hypothetical protein
MEVGKRVVNNSIITAGDPVEVHKIFLDRIWRRGGLPPMFSWMEPFRTVSEAIDEAGTGAAREVPGKVIEKVTAAELGNYIEYTLAQNYSIPVSYHSARITFEKVDDNQTKVTWKISFTPRFFTGPILSMFFNFFFSKINLPQLDKECRRKLLK